jgi:protein-S-isoprenylcysteine O-methyltransferase Ste14
MAAVPGHRLVNDEMNDSSGPPRLREAIGPVIGSLAFFVIAPGTVAFWIPWRLTRWRMGPPLLDGTVVRAAGVLVVLAGLVPLVESFARFALRGLGTPAPLMPTRRLVVTGFYRHVRNPMYVGVVSIVVGQALLLGSRTLLAYAAAVWLAFHLFVLLYEEPTLRARYGAEYAAYCAGVRRWWPRLRPWKG